MIISSTVRKIFGMRASKCTYPANVILALQLALISGLANSQEAEKTNYSLEEVFVEAQKRLETEQDVTASFNVYNEDYLEETSWEDITDLADLIPSLEVVGTTKTRKSVFIRSIGTNKYDIGTEGSVGIFVDGVYIPRVSSIMQNLMDIDRVEILRGPQGTLYGRNTIGGAISLYSKAPDYNWKRTVKASYSDPESTELTLQASGPLSDKVRVFLGGYTKDESGFRYEENSGLSDDEHVDGLRGTIEWDATDELNIKFSADHITQKIDSFTGEYISQDGSIWGISGPTTAPFISLEERNAYLAEEASDSFRNRATVPGFTDLEASSANLQLKWVGSDLRFDSITGFRDQTLIENLDEDRTVYDIFEYDVDENSRTWSQELRVASEEGGAFTYDDKLSWVAGVYLYDDAADRTDRIWLGEDNNLAGVIDTLSMAIWNDDGVGQPPELPRGQPIPVQRFANIFSPEAYADLVDSLPLFSRAFGIPQSESLLDFLPPPYPIDFIVDMNTRSWATFGQGTYYFHDDWSLTLGARYSKDTKDYTYAENAYLIGFFSSDPEGETFSFDDTIDDSSFDPKVVLEWRPPVLDDVLTYLSYTKGYKGGGIQYAVRTRELADDPFKKERLYATELGVKSRWLNEKLQANGSVYHYDYRDQQIILITTAMTGSGPIITPITVNAPKSTVIGLEADVKYLFTENFLAQVTVSSMNSEFDKFYVFGQDFTGNSLANSPEFSTWISVQYTRPTSVGDFGLRLDHSWRDKQYFTADNSYEEDAYDLVNISLSYTTSNENISARLFCTNCFDTEHHTSVIPLTNNSAWAATGDLRRTGVALVYKF